MADPVPSQPIASQAADMVLVAQQLATLARLLRPVIDEVSIATDENRLFHLNEAVHLSFLAEATADRLAGMAEVIEQDARRSGRRA